MKKIEFKELECNPAELFGRQWMLVTAGTPDDFNTMTASWGGLGFLWNRPVAFVFVRPNRYTNAFISKHPSFTLSFMPEKYRKDLVFCGRHSGRDVDKMAETQLAPFVTEGGLVAMQDADLALEVRKMACAPMNQADFLDWSEVSPRFYAEDNPLHLVYVCEIVGAFVREG